MAITEQDRHRMYQRLEEVLGSEEAATLMEHLPPVGWADVARKRDIDHLDGRIEQLGDRLRAEWRHELLVVTFAILGANTALAAAAFAAARFV